jgi:hypothetical protein
MIFPLFNQLLKTDDAKASLATPRDRERGVAEQND